LKKINLGKFIELLNKLKYFSICILALNIKNGLLKKKQNNKLSCGFTCREVFWGISYGIFYGIICEFVAESLLWIYFHFQQEIPRESFMRISKSAGNNNPRRY
jgi:hypothetical protein